MNVVMVSGASGFLGSHVVQRLLDRGDEVRALVRTPAKLRANLALLGVDPDDPRLHVVPGDMTDAPAVREAASGCDQAVHAAATFSYRRRDAERMLQENKVGTTTVLDATIEAGCAGIVHVSSIAALLRPGRPWTTGARWGSRSAPTPRARWSPSASPGTGRTRVPRSPSSTRAASWARTTPTSVRATRWFATS